MRRHASHDEVKRAFLDLALRFHPDRMSDRSSTSLERAAFRMTEVNAAWAVLRNPAARARYDERLDDDLRAQAAADADAARVPAQAYATASASAGSVHREPAGAAPWAMGNEPDEIADLAATNTGSADTFSSTSRWLIWAPLLVGGVVLLVVLSALALNAPRSPKIEKVRTDSSFAVNKPGSSPDGNDLSPSSFDVGSCIAVRRDGSFNPPAYAIASVPCTGDHDGRVTNRPATTCDADESSFILPSEPTPVCWVG